MRLGYATIVLMLFCVGCSAWPEAQGSLARLRDDRAADIDGRLSHRESPVRNPFGAADDADKAE